MTTATSIALSAAVLGLTYAVAHLWRRVDNLRDSHERATRWQRDTLTQLRLDVDSIDADLDTKLDTFP